MTLFEWAENKDDGVYELGPISVIVKSGEIVGTIDNRGIKLVDIF